MAIKEQVKAISNKIQNPKICLNEKVLDGIKNLKLDQEVTITITGKVIEVSRERDWSEMPTVSEVEKEPKKILKADFEITKATIK